MARIDRELDCFSSVCRPDNHLGLANCKPRFLYIFFASVFFLFASPNETLAQINYDILNPPSEPTRISVGFYLSDINAVSEQEETFEFEAMISLTWKDDRQAFDPDFIGSEKKTFTGPFQFLEIYRGWWPQLVLANESGKFDIQGRQLEIQSDGTLQLRMEVNGIAEMPMALRKFPFDRQHFRAYFSVLGYSDSQVLLEPNLDLSGQDDEGSKIAEWKLRELTVRDETFRPSLQGKMEFQQSRIVASLDMERQSGFMLRLVIAPLALLCFLTFSVFWMDHETLGDRMTISFTGLLTVVAYQFLLQGSLPTIAYFTLMDGFLFSTYIFVGLTVCVNLRVDHLNRGKRHEAGDRLDERCRWIFPLAFVATNAALYFISLI